MEEERAYAEALKARDEEEERKPSRSRRSSRSRGKSKAEKLSSDDAVDSTEPQISGMETIDLSEQDDGASAAEDNAVDTVVAEPGTPEGTSPMDLVAETPVEEPLDEPPADDGAPEAASDDADAVTSDEVPQGTEEDAAQESAATADASL